MVFVVFVFNNKIFLDGADEFVSAVLLNVIAFLNANSEQKANLKSCDIFGCRTLAV